MPILGAGTATPKVVSAAPASGAQAKLDALVAEAKKLRAKLIYPGTTSGERQRINQRLQALQNEMVKVRKTRTEAEKLDIIKSKWGSGKLKLPPGVFKAMEKAGYKLYQPETGIVRFVGGKGDSMLISGHEALRRWEIAKERIERSRKELETYQRKEAPVVGPSLIDDANRIAQDLKDTQGLTDDEAAKQATQTVIKQAAENKPAQAPVAPAAGPAGASAAVQAPGAQGGVIPAVMGIAGAILAWKFF